MASDRIDVPTWCENILARTKRLAAECLQLVGEHPAIIGEMSVFAVIASNSVNDGSLSLVTFPPRFDDLCDLTAKRIKYYIDRKEDERNAPGYYGGDRGGEDPFACWLTGLLEQLQQSLKNVRVRSTSFYPGSSSTTVANVVILLPLEHDGIRSVTFDFNRKDDLVEAILSLVLRNAADIIKYGDDILSPHYNVPDVPDSVALLREAAARLIPNSDDAYEDYYYYKPSAGMSFIEILSGMTYEGEACGSRITFSSDPNALDRCEIQLSEAIPFTVQNARIVRKILQAAQNRSVIVRDHLIIGISALSVPGSGARSGSERSIAFTGLFRYEFRRGDNVLFEARGGIPKCVQRNTTLLDLSRFFANVLGDKEVAQKLADRVLPIANTLTGAILVFTENASTEAQRLKLSSFPISHINIRNHDAVSSIAMVDGAVIADLAGTCHAFGAILDGIASGEGENPARGSRFNSAQRYVATHRQRGILCAAIVFSDDGGVTFI